MDLNDFKGCVIVVAHPDDEMLWASSLVTSARKIIFCYGNTPASTKVSEGREALVRSFPLSTLVSLNITESNTHQTANWHKPVETPFGIQCSRNSKAYANNFRLLTEALKEHLQEGDVVVTHNPWGEYGHEEHVQVFRSVSQIKQQRDFRLFVTGYVSDRVIQFMEQNTLRIGPATALLPTDKDLCAILKRHYQQHDAWTWDDAYEWPQHECFYEVTKPNAPLDCSRRTKCSMPVNVIWLDGRLPIWRRLLRTLKRRLLMITYIFAR
jgi:hypothetical protein